MYRSTKHNAVGLFHQRQNVNDWPAEYAVSGFGAAAAAHTAAHRRRADVEDRRLDARFVQHLGHLGQGCVGAAVFVRTAVDQQYIHSKYLRFGFALITEERKANGLFLKGDLTFNTTIANLNAYKKGVAISDPKMVKATSNEIKIMHTKCMGPGDMISSLSGGNQQKVIFGKWLERGPQVFMMDEPTRGIDV